MGFAKIAPVGNIHDFSWFGTGEFFRFNGNIWVKYNSHAAVNITNITNNADIDQEFPADAECENIEVELKVL